MNIELHTIYSNKVTTLEHDLIIKVAIYFSLLGAYYIAFMDNDYEL